MASPLVSRAPKCMSCIRQAVGGIGGRLLFPAGQQTRGKKKLRKTPNKVNALLLEDVKGYGKQGNVISIVAGVMRNQWYPQRKAEYATAARMKELGLKQEDIIEAGTLPVAEDIEPKESSVVAAEAEKHPGNSVEMPGYTPFLRPGKAKKVKAAPKSAPASDPVQPPEPQVLVPTPEEAITILSMLVPEDLVLRFPRTTVTAPQVKKISPSLPAKAAVSIAAGRGGKPQKTAIYGSVSTTDIALELKSHLLKSERGVLVSISPEDITFIEAEEDSTRVKHVGKYDVGITFKDAPTVIRRTIEITAAEG